MLYSSSQENKDILDLDIDLFCYILHDMAGLWCKCSSFLYTLWLQYRLAFKILGLKI